MRNLQIAPVDLTADLAGALCAEVALVHVIDPKLAVRPGTGVPAATLLFELRCDGRQLLSAAAACANTASNLRSDEA